MNILSTVKEDFTGNSYSQVELEGAVKYRPKSSNSSKLTNTASAPSPAPNPQKPKVKEKTSTKAQDKPLIYSDLNPNPKEKERKGRTKPFLMYYSRIHPPNLPSPKT
jgi:hypothetical protein